MQVIIYNYLSDHMSDLCKHQITPDEDTIGDFGIIEFFHLTNKCMVMEINN